MSATTLQQIPATTLQQIPATTLQQIPAGVYDVDPAHSNVGFEVRHMGIATVRGRFGGFEGTIAAAEGAPVLAGTVQVATIDTGEAGRDGHLNSPEFFDAERHPQITFSSTATDMTPDGLVTLTGEITIKGVTRPIDWASRPHGADAALWGKPVAVVGASVTDYGAMWAQDHLRRALGITGARVLDAELPVARAADLFGDDGELTDPETRERLAEMVQALVAHHGRHTTTAIAA